MKRKITGILMCLMMLCMSLLAGCSLVETDYKNYYTQTVALVEDKESKQQYAITMKELISSYESYGYYYEQYYGYSRADAIKMTLEGLEGNKIKLIKAKEKFGISDYGDGLTEKEKTYLFEETAKSLKSNLDYYYKAIAGEGETTTEETASKIFKQYEKNAEFDGENIVRINATNELLSDFSYTQARDFNKEDDRKIIYQTFIANLSNDNYKKAYAKYYRNLKANEVGMGLSTLQKDVFEREIERIYNAVFDNYLISKYDESLLDAQSTSVTPQQIVDLYSSKVRGAYTQYVIEQDANYDSTMQSSAQDVYYVKTGDEDTRYFTVANVLFQFSETQQAQYNAYTAKYNAQNGNGYDWDAYQSDIQALYDNIKPLVREYDEESESYVEKEVVLEENQTYKDVINSIVAEMTSDLANAQATGSANTIGDTINDIVFRYNSDPGMFDEDKNYANYIVGQDKDGNAVSANFVEEFENGAVELFDNGSAEIGDISAQVETSYGIHYLIYTGECKNLFDGIDSSFQLNTDAIEILCATRVNPRVNKTYFDLLYDELYSDNSSNFKNAHLELLKADFQIYEYPQRYNSLVD